MRLMIPEEEFFTVRDRLVDLKVRGRVEKSLMSVLGYFSQNVLSYAPYVHHSMPLDSKKAET
jgi:hypothetical protein